jgi:carbamoyl-phosphate synthase large subunit
MLNCNPETVSTDYDIADKLYFEAITVETVLEIVRIEQPLGIIVQFGGQTPLKITKTLQQEGVCILGTTPASIECAEDRKQFNQLIQKLQLQHAPSIIVHDVDELLSVAKQFDYPYIIRPSNVLGGSAMAIIKDIEQLRQYLNNKQLLTEFFPILIETYLSEAIEIDVDAIVDHKGEVFIAGIMEHVEFAGTHSGDSSCVLPPHSLTMHIQMELSRQISLMAKELNVIGLINAQFAIKNGVIYVLEVNPRASRTIPFIAKARKIPLCKIAVSCIMGNKLLTSYFNANCHKDIVAVKYPVFSQLGLTSAGISDLGPEMKSTGEVMGIATSFVDAYSKCLIAAGTKINNFVSLNMHSSDKLAIAKCMNNTHNSIYKLQEL